MATQLSDAALAYGEEITTALLGVDALFRAEGSAEGLAVLNMSTRHQPERFGRGHSPTPSGGNMLQDAQSTISSAPWLTMRCPPPSR